MEDLKITNFIPYDEEDVVYLVQKFPNLKEFSCIIRSTCKFMKKYDTTSDIRRMF